MGRAVGVTCGWGVVMWGVLVVRCILLETCTSEGGAAPGALTTAAARGPIIAKAWTYGCCLTAVVTSHWRTGLEKKYGNWVAVINIGIKNITIRAARILSSVVSGQALTTICPLSDLHQKWKQDVVLITNLHAKPTRLFSHFLFTLTPQSPPSFLPPSRSTRCCETPFCHGWDVFLLQKRWLVW